MASTSQHHDSDSDEHFSDNAPFVSNGDSESNSGMTSGQQTPEASKGKKKVGWSLPSSEPEDEDGNEPGLDELRRVVRWQPCRLSCAYTFICGVILSNAA